MNDVAAYRVFVSVLFPLQGGMWTAVHIPPCSGNSTSYKLVQLIVIHTQPAKKRRHYE